MIDVIMVAKPGRYVAVRCDEPECLEEAREASTEQRAIRNALAANFSFNDDGTVTCGLCRRAKERA